MYTIRTVSYTHLDVYKRQHRTYLLSGKWLVLLTWLIPHNLMIYLEYTKIEEMYRENVKNVNFYKVLTIK